MRLKALQNYYGNPGSVFPFHYLNPGGYVTNVTFWLRALDDYKKGEVSFFFRPLFPTLLVGQRFYLGAFHECFSERYLSVSAL